MNLLLAAALLFQEQTAEEAFKKIEETITSAKTLSLKIKITITAAKEGKEEQQSAQGLLLLKGDKKLYSSFDAKGPNQEDQRILVVSDGEFLQSHSKALDHGLETPAQPRFRSLFEYSFIRGGGVGVMSMTAIFCGLVHDARKMEPDPKKLVRVGGLARGDDPKNPSLTFSSKMDHFGPNLKITLWYDPATHKPLKSLIVNVDNGAKIAEVYEEFVLNADIPDEKFKLPDEKK